jgi:hypothetical protein
MTRRTAEDAGYYFGRAGVFVAVPTVFVWRASIERLRSLAFPFTFSACPKTVSADTPITPKKTSVDFIEENLVGDEGFEPPTHCV